MHSSKWTILFKTEKIGIIDQYLTEIIGLQDFVISGTENDNNNKLIGFGDLARINGNILTVAERFSS